MAKKLIKGEKKFFGVCSGFANYIDIDPTVDADYFCAGLLGFWRRAFGLCYYGVNYA